MLNISNNSINNYDHPLLHERVCVLDDNIFVQGNMPEEEEYYTDIPLYMSNLIQVPMTEEVLVTIPHPEEKLRSPRAQTRANYLSPLTTQCQ
jgi:hypothetical protein